MKNILLSGVAILILTVSATSQKYFTKNGKINFDATSPNSPEKIEGVNKTVTCVMDTKTGNIQFAALMKGFEFERSLMEEHFNENYVESDKFPRSEFKGLITNNDKVNYSKSGVYPVKVSGKLTMHGETKDITTDGKLTVDGTTITVSANFDALLSDYKIAIPGLVADKVSRTAKIIVNCSLELLKG